MGRRSRIEKYQVMSSADTTTSPQAEETDISSVDFIIYHLQVDSSVNATLNVYFENSKVFDSTKKELLNFGQSTPIVGSTDTDYMIVVENKGFKWMFFDLVNNGGTGNASAWITGTVRGA